MRSVVHQSDGLLAPRPPGLAKQPTWPLRVSWVDAAVFLAVIGLVAVIGYRVESVLHYHWHWARVVDYLVRRDGVRGTWTANLLLQGFFMTLRLSVWGIIGASLLGLVMGIFRTNRLLLPRLGAFLYVGLVRNTPPLVFIFIFYFFISGRLIPLLGLDGFATNASPAAAVAIDIFCGDPKLFVNFATGLMCLVMFEGAYVTEIVRAGIQSIERGQWEAGRSLGLSHFQLLRLVILPQALRRIVPPLAGQFVTLIKTSSIVSLISIEELTFAAGEVAVSTGCVFEVWLTAAGMYLAVCYPCSVVLNRLERRFNRLGGS